MEPKNRSNHRGVRFPTFLKKGWIHWLWRRKDLLALEIKLKGNEENEDDFPESDFKRGVADDEDGFLMMMLINMGPKNKYTTILSLLASFTASLQPWPAPKLMLKS